MDPIVEIAEVSKRFGDRLAVDGVSLAVPRGQFFSLLGPSGCGKTTILRLIGGFEQPDAGEVRIDGRRANEMPPYRRNVCTVFQSYALFPHLTVEGNIAFGLEQAQARRSRAEIRDRVARMLDLVQLPGAGGRRTQELSGGEKQRVALARSLVLEPGVLLLDEPLASLDQKLRREMRWELKRVQRAVGITFLFVTHDQEEALTLSDTIAVMSRGRIEQIGTPEEVYRRPRTRFVAGFIGSSNLIEGGGRVVMVRPEHVHIADGPAPAGSQTVSGKVLHSQFLGPHQQVSVEIEPGRQLLALAAPGPAWPPGTAVTLWWDRGDALALGD